MAGKTQDQADAVLGTARGAAMAAWTPWVCLFSAAPADDSAAGTELSGGGYSRVSVSLDPPVDASGVKLARRCYVDEVVVFPTATVDWAEAVAWGIKDASSGGTLRYWKALPANRTIPAGDRLELTAGTVYIEEG